MRPPNAHPTSGAEPMRITGERVVSPVGGFNPTWQRHVAAYDRLEPILGQRDPVLDLGCGVGHSYHRLAPRTTVGVDIDPDALAGQERETVVADMRRLPFGESSFPAVVAVQSLEHVPDPERTLAEVARVLEPRGVAIFVTPNRLTLGRPDEIIDPYHYVEFDAEELERLCRASFGEVEVMGLFGSPQYMELFAEERATLDRLLRLDPLVLRRWVPRKGRQWLYDNLLRRFRTADDDRAERIAPDDFELRTAELDQCLDLVAVCELPCAAADPGNGSNAIGRSPTTCVWCGGALDRHADHLRARTGCRRCGVGTTDPWPTDLELQAAYGDWYRPRSGRRFMLAGDSVLDRTRASLAGRLDQIAPQGPVLDIGAGDGVLVDALRHTGREAVGVERNRSRPDFRDDPLDQIEDGWAAIVFWHSLEHLPAPGEAVREAVRLLRPGGIIAIAVPNSDSLQSRIFGDRWLHLDIPRHLVHLSKRALLDRLTELGFEIETVSDVRGGQIVIGWLDGLVGLLPGRPRLYEALRRPDASAATISRGRRWMAVAAGIAFLPLALLGAALEVALGRSGTVYVEARHG